MKAYRSIKKGSIKLLLLLTIVGLNSCKLADLRTSAIDPLAPDREKKAIGLLERAVTHQGFDILAAARTYSYEASDNWRGLMAVFNPFPKDNEVMEMRFRTHTFDSQFNYKNAKGTKIYGVQSFQYYEIEDDGTPTFKNKKSLRFTLPAIQYLFELPLRLQKAPIVKYAGSAVVEGATYDLVFATWESLEPNKEFDQYLLYLSQETGRLSFASYTVRNAYLPTPKNVYGSIRYEALKENKEGVLYPTTLYIQINTLKNNRRWTHKMSINHLELNSFNHSLLYPNKDLKFLGDAKN